MLDVKYDRFAFMNNLLKTDSKYIIIVLDVINFSKINDKYGVLEGDYTLKQIINYLDFLSLKHKGEFDSCVYEKDTILIKLNTLDINKAKEIIASISFNEYKYDIYFRGAYRRINNYKEAISFTENINKVLRKDRYIVNEFNLSNLDISEDLEKYRELKEDLLGVDKQSSFKLAYQPKIDVKNEKVVSCEALARWNHPKLGEISTLEFMYIVKDLNREYEFDMFILTQLCKEISFLKKYLNSFSVNMSINTLKKENIHNEIYDLFYKYDVDPKSIVIEILEDKNVDDYDIIIKSLNNLTNFGFRISIDDFGSGYSSYHRLCFLNFSEVKIPREFLLECNIYREKNHKILSAIIDMCRSLGCKIVSEGIETEEDLSLMKSVGTDYVQGFLYSKPLELNLFIEFINNYIRGGNKGAIL